MKLTALLLFVFLNSFLLFSHDNNLGKSKNDDSKVKGSQIRESEVRAFAKQDFPFDDLTCGGNDTAMVRNLVWPAWQDSLVSYSLYSYNQGIGQDRVIYGLQENSYKFEFWERGANGEFEVLAVFNNYGSIDSASVGLCVYSVDYSAPRLIYPECGTMAFDTVDNAQLTWESDAQEHRDNVYHEFTIREFNKPTTERRFWKVLNKNINVRLLDLKANTRYEWRVRVVGDNHIGVHEWSPYCDFTTSPLLSVKEADTEDYKVISASGMIEVRSDKMIQSLSLIDLTGKQVAKSDNLIINTSNLSTGMYFLLIDGQRFMKVMVE